MAEGRRKPGTVVWWGHATVEIHLDGATVLTDPVLTRRVGHLVRRRGGSPPVDVHSPDAVLLSHLHSDHTHLPSLAKVSATTPIVLPRGASQRLRGLRKLGNPLVDISVGETVGVGALRITAVPADHDGRRWRHGPRDVDALGYVITGSSIIYFAGDTAIFDAMAEWVPRCDLALLPVGGWGPTLGAGHMDARAAARAASAMHARMSIPIHHGTLWPVGLDRFRPHLFHEPGADFVVEASSLGMPATLLDPGEPWQISY